MNRRIKCKIAKRIIVFNQTAHKALWTWIAENVSKSVSISPSEFKTNWPGWKSNGGTVPYARHFCLACQYAKEVSYKTKRNRCRCKYCPLSVKGNGDASDCLSGLYTEWEEAFVWNDLEEKKKLALKIANLPVKKYVKTI